MDTNVTRLSPGKRRDDQMNIGSASIVLLLMVFALTVFALLAMKASYQELKRSEKVRDSVEEYYAADAKSEESLAFAIEKMNEAIEKGKEGSQEALAYFDEEINQYEDYSFDKNSQILTFITPFDYNKHIETQFFIEKDFTSYWMISHKILVLGQEDYNQEELDLWDGIIEE